MADSDRLRASDSADVTDRIATLARSGLPLIPGLAALAEELPRGPFQRLMYDLVRSLENGLPLEQALKNEESRLPPQLKGLVSAGLRSGRLGEMLARFSAYANVGIDLRRKLRLSLIYPICTVGAAFVLFFFICTIVVPQFEDIFKDFGLPVPLLTRHLISLSHLFREMVMPLVTVTIIAFVAWFFGLFIKQDLKRSLVGRIPVAGRVWRYCGFAEYFHLLALLLENQVPLPDAIRLAGDGVQNLDLQRMSEIAAREVEEGNDLADALTIAGGIPGGFSRLLKWAEKPGSLEEVLHMVAEMFEARAKAQLSFASTFLGIMSFVFILWTGAIVVLGLMLPLFTLLSRLSG